MSILQPSIEMITRTKPKSSIPKEISNAINIISLDKGNVIPFGSWIYTSQLYPADIDLTETDKQCCNREDNINFFVSALQKIVKRIISSNSNGYYLGDIKAGLDDIYKLDIGILKYDNQGNYTIYGYNPEAVRNQINQLFQNGLLKENETALLLSFAKDNISANDYENLYDALREKWLLRWSGEEILRGYKVLAGNRQKLLRDAIQDYTLTKIDMWKSIFGRYLEITDVYGLVSVDNNGNEELLNKMNILSELIDNLKEEVQKYAFSNKFFKPFKMIKRMWSIARLTGDNNMVRILTPFMQTDIGRLSQITSEIETLIAMLENIKTPPLRNILEQIDGFKLRLSNVYAIEWDQEGIDQILDEITSIGDRQINIPVRQYIIDRLEEIEKYFKEIINNHTIEFLERVGLYPPPASYLPN